jgi:flagellar motor switch protein FliN
MNVDDALVRLGESTSEAVAGILQMFAGDAAQPGPVAIVAPGTQPLQALSTPAVTASVSYVDGVTGGNVFLLPVDGARRLVATMTGDGGAPSAEGAELTEIELSAVGEAMNQMMSAAAVATAGVLGQEVEIAPPQIRVVATEAEAADLLRASAAPHMLTTGFTVADAAARLVQLVPNAFVVRMERALDSQTTEYTNAPLGDALRAVPVRVWAELGRAQMPAGASLGLPTGSVVELDREVDDPVDLYVDGLRFASGRLVVAEDGSVQLEVDEVHGLDRQAPVLEAPIEEPQAPESHEPQTEPESPTESMEV